MSDFDGKENIVARIAVRDAAAEDGAVTAHLRDLTPDPSNRRAHNPRNVSMIADSLQAVGAARSIVIDEDGVVLAGNATIEAAAEAGIEQVRIVDATGHELIAVRRRGLTPAQKRTLALADNRTAELATWNLDQLRADAADGLDLASFFAPAELADLLGADAPVPKFEPVDANQRLDELQPHCGTCTCRKEPG
jgi:ParB-like chromosome segregation protein Spo0J